MSSFLRPNVLSRENSVGVTNNDDLLGAQWIFNDESLLAGTTSMVRNSGVLVHCTLIKNSTGSAIPAGTAVKWGSGGPTAGLVEVCGAGEDCDGIVDPEGGELSNGSHGLMVTEGPVRDMLAAAETFAVGDLVKTGASGVATAAVSKRDAGYIGVVLTATTTNSDPVDVLVELQGSLAANTVQTKTSDYTVLATESGDVFDTTGAAGTVVFTMPAAVPGLKYRFHVGVAQELRIDPDGTETVSLPSTGVPGAAGKYLTANAIGETVVLECVVAGNWACMGYTGTWTAEA